MTVLSNQPCTSKTLAVGETIGGGLVVVPYPFPSAILDGWAALVDPKTQEALFEAAYTSGKYVDVAWKTFAEDALDPQRNNILFIKLPTKLRDALFMPVTAPGQALTIRRGAEAKMDADEAWQAAKRNALGWAKMSGLYNRYAWEKLIGNEKQWRRILFVTMDPDAKETVLSKLAANKAWEKKFGCIRFEPTTDGELKLHTFPRQSNSFEKNTKALNEWRAQFSSLVSKREVAKRRQLSAMVESGRYTVFRMEMDG